MSNEVIQKLSPEDGQSKDLISENVEKLKQLFPEIVTDGKVDFDTLKEVLGEFTDNSTERYSFTWNGKSQARKLAMTPSRGTLRPAPEESVNWDSTQNLFIEGDNLEVLKLMQRSYHKKVKMIYIDPPYNTGKDFVYKDNFKDNIRNYKEITGQLDSEGKSVTSNPETSGRYHTDWLNMIYPRLKLARELLKDDGVIFVSIDDNEVENLKKVCSEIFGEENFLGQLIIQTATDNNKTQINTEHEYMVVFAKSKDSQPYWSRRSEAADKIQNKYEELKRKYEDDLSTIEKSLRAWIAKNKDSLPKVTHYDNVDERGVFHDGDIANTKYGGYDYQVIHPVTNKACKVPDKGFRFPEKTMKKLIEKNDIVFGRDHNTLIKPKKRLQDAKDALRTIIYEDGRASTKVVESLIGRDVFKNPKSHFIIARLIEFCTDNDDLIVDFFAGSASTAQALYQAQLRDGKKRKYLLVQLPEVIEKSDKDSKRAYDFCINQKKPPLISEISKERIRRVGLEIMRDNQEFSGDLGFKVFKLDTSNIKPWDPDFDQVQLSLEDTIENVKPGRTELDVLYEILLKYGLDLALPIEEREIAGAKIYVGGAGAIVLCLSDRITLDVVEGIAEIKKELQPELMRVVFRDGGFKNDVDKTNAVQILKQNGIEDVRSI